MQDLVLDIRSLSFRSLSTRSLSFISDNIEGLAATLDVPSFEKSLLSMKL